MPRLSIVIPNTVFDSHVEQTLVSVLQNRPEYSEVLVVTAHPYDDPYDLGREVRFLCHGEAQYRIDLINHGCKEARGDLVHLLLPGSLAVDGWTDRVTQHFANEKVAAVAPIIVPHADASRAGAFGVTYSASGRRRIVGAGTDLTKLPVERCGVLAPTLTAGFYRHHVLDALQGFDRELGEPLADVELGLALQDLGLTTVVEPHSRVVVRQPVSESPRTWHEGRCAELLFRRQAMHTGGAKLGHALLLATEFVCGFPHARMITGLGGRLVARRETDPRTRYENRLGQARAALGQPAVPTICYEFSATVGEVTERPANATGGRRSAA